MFHISVPIQPAILDRFIIKHKLYHRQYFLGLAEDKKLIALCVPCINESCKSVEFARHVDVAVGVGDICIV